MAMRNPDWIPPRLAAARAGEADEADLIEQAYAVPLGDDERGFDR